MNGTLHGPDPSEQVFFRDRSPQSGITLAIPRSLPCCFEIASLLFRDLAVDGHGNAIRAYRDPRVAIATQPIAPDLYSNFMSSTATSIFTSLISSDEESCFSGAMCAMSTPLRVTVHSSSPALSRQTMLPV